MNGKSNTFLDSGKGTLSALDLSLCHPSVYLDLDWSVCEDQHESDHFPIVIESIKAFEEDHNPKWKLNKANWDLFHFYAIDPYLLHLFLTLLIVLLTLLLHLLI